MGQQIGQMNGKWAVLFKALLSVGALLVPCIVALQVWQVQQIYSLRESSVVMEHDLKSFVAMGPGYTPKDARADNLELRTELLSEISKNYPPQWLTKELESVSRRVEAIERHLNGSQP